MSDQKPIKIELSISPETEERISFVVQSLGLSERETAEKLPADQAEAEAALIRGPWLRKHIYR